MGPVGRGPAGAVQPTRSAITVAGSSGCSPSRVRTRASNGANDVVTGMRWYFGGRSEANARSTVARPIPSRRATCRRGTPSATSRLIRAQSSTEITHPICLGGLVFNRRYGLVFARRRQSNNNPGENETGGTPEGVPPVAGNRQPGEGISPVSRPQSWWSSLLL